MRLSHVDPLEFASEMDPDYLPDEGPSTVAASPRYKRSSSEPDFGFAFNDINFSDRVLRIEILPDLPNSKSDSDGCSTIADWARNRKRRREDIMMENEVTQNEEEQDFNCNMPDPDEAVAYENENQDEEVVAMVEEPSVDCGMTSIEPDNEVTERSESSSSMDCSVMLKVKNIHISSPILAVKSPFFYKLFSNGMKESDQRQVTLRIHASEEAALMELLNFIYSNCLSTVSPSALLDILMAADKYEVASCMRYCSRLLRNQPMTCESALLYLDLPSNVQMGDAVQPLTDAAKQFLAARYKDITKFQEEVLSLPLAGIEAVMSSDDLQVASEDAVFDFLLKWARMHYPKLEDRREILGTSLARLIRFPYMTCRKLRKVQVCNDFEQEKAGELVLESLFFKSEPPHRQRAIIAENSSSGSSRQFVERTYRYRPVKALELVKPQQHCMVFLDLTREECMSLYPTGRIYSQAFHLGGQGFFLSAHCNMDQQSSFHCFGLFLGMQEKGLVSFAVDYEFAARSNPTADFASKYKGNYKFTGGKAVGYRNLFGMAWTAFMAEDSPYFINGTLHLRADLTIKQ